ncbi:MAG: hypothetical protein OXI55_04025 [Gammaproteobacteria bacterium]|nr:hypothetical protein [Gammaproteobacteria bacterium]
MAGIDLSPDLRIRAFLFAFVGGTVAIVAIRAILPHLGGAVLATLIAVLAIFALGMRSRRAESRAQAGDDLYYLGLLFTLVSLIWALVQLFILDAGESDAAARTNQLVGNFGIALVSTVAGIVGRILFQGGIGAMSARPAAAAEEAAAEREDEQRLHAEAAREVRDQARQARDALSHFTRMTLTQAEETRRHTERLAQEFNQHMKGLAEAGLTETSKAWQELAAMMRRDAEQLARKIDAAVMEATARTEVAWRDVAANAESASADARAATAEARANVDAINTEVKAMLERIAAVSSLLPAFATGLEQAEASAGRLARTADDAAVGLDARAAEIVSAHNALAQGARSYSDASVEAYRHAVEKSLQDALGQLKLAGERWLNVVEEFHQAGQKQREAGMQAAAQADELTRRMSTEAEHWAGLAERTRKGIVEAVEDLTKVVRKA